MQPTGNFTYTVNFENEATATAPAQTVTVTEQLDPNLDWSTFQFGDIGFGNFTISVPPGRTSFSTRVDATATLGVFVDVSANFNLKTGVITWTFTALDPKTLDLPSDPTVGFLPPNTNAPEGQGFVSYTVHPKAALATGTQINAQATVVFDTNAPINTAPMFNTIDSAPPTSSVNSLPATETTPNFTVSWSGQDDKGGSGIAFFDIFVSTDGGPFTLWQNQTTETSATFNGDFGHTYAFYSIATDNVGNVEATPTEAQATTFVGQPSPPPAPPPAPPPPPPSATPPASSVTPLPATESSPSFTVSWSGSDPNGPGIAFFSIYVSVDGGAFTPWLTDTTQTSATYTGQAGHGYGFYSVATDTHGLSQPAPAGAQATTFVPLPPASPPPPSPPTTPPSSSPSPPPPQPISLPAALAEGIQSLELGFAIDQGFPQLLANAGSITQATDLFFAALGLLSDELSLFRDVVTGLEAPLLGLSAAQTATLAADINALVADMLANPLVSRGGPL